MNRRIVGLLFACLAGSAGILGCRTSNSGSNGPVPALNLGGKPNVEASLAPRETATACLTTAKELDKADDFEPAIELYEKARQNDPKLTGRVCRRLAILYDRKGDFDKATVEYERALQLTPKDADLLVNLGYSYYARGELTQAEKYLGQALKIAPNNKRGWNNLGLVLAMQERREESLAAFEKAVSPAQARANLGFMLAAQGKREEAKTNYQEALKLDPNLTLAKSALAKLSDPNFGVVPAKAEASTGAPPTLPQTATFQKQSNQPSALPTDAPILIDPN